MLVVATAQQTLASCLTTRAMNVAALSWLPDRSEVSESPRVSALSGIWKLSSVQVYITYIIER